MASSSISNTVGRFEGAKRHTPARLLKSLVGKEEWDYCFTFGAYRNPYDRVVSFFHHHVKIIPLPEIRKPEFKNWLFGLEKDEIEELMPSCWEMLSENGSLIVKEALQYENLAEEWRTKIYPHFRTELVRHDHKSDRFSNYRGYYDDECTEYVAVLYKDDLEQWDYQF